MSTSLLSDETKKSRRLILLFSVISHIFAPLLFKLRSWDIPVDKLFFSHFSVLVLISMILSFVIYHYRDTVPCLTFILIKFLILHFIGYPLGDYIGIELILFTSLIIETGILLDSPINKIVLSIENLMFLLFQRNLSAWGYQINSVSNHDLLFSFLYCTVFSLLILYLSINIADRKRKSIKIERLDSAISQLTDANIGFQKYVKEQELETIITERKRLSREIHDAVGYSLTNIIMLLEAAFLLVDQDPQKQKKVISDAKKQAISGLEETRTALRHLRDDKTEKLHGIYAIDELIRAFRDATGIMIKVEYGNLPIKMDEITDSIIFRMIQEGMTNAFRHGMATQIIIIFWYDSNIVRLSIHDNGSGSADVVEGIGLAGMRERLENINGRLTFKNVVDGFELGAEIPWEENN